MLWQRQLLAKGLTWKSCEGAEILHDPEVYGGKAAYFRSPDIGGEVTIFPSGKMISAGTKSETEAFYALDYAKEFLVEKGFVVPVALQKKIQNIVAVVDLVRNVNLEELARSNAKMIYEPEQFPGAILRMDELSRVAVLIFASGKVVITGLKDLLLIEPLTRKIEEIILPYT